MGSLITEATIQIRKDTAGNWTSNNPTPASGEWCKEIDTGNIKQGDGSTPWNDLNYTSQLPFTNDLTSGNITHTLPEITGYPQTESIYWENGGTFKITLAVTSGEIVGGISAGTWEGEGEGHMIVESDGSNWQVREYEDRDSDWRKYRDGKYECYGFDLGLGGTTTTTVTFPVTFIGDVPIINDSIGVNDTPMNTIRLRNTTTTTQTQYKNAVAFTNRLDYTAIGRWRT